LVELLVSAALTLILLGGVFSIALNSRSTLTASDALSQRLLEAKQALDELVVTLREAGFQGCSRTSTFFEVVADAETEPGHFAFGKPLEAFSAEAFGRKMRSTLLQERASNFAPISDVLLVRRIRKGAPLMLEDGMGEPTDDLLVSSSANSVSLVPGDVAMIYDCNAAAIFAVSAVNDQSISHRTPLNVHASLGYSFPQGSQILALDSIWYFVARDPQNPEEPPSLWRMVNATSPRQVAAGVENMRLLFADGRDKRHDFVPADTVIHWDDVDSVALQLKIAARGRKDTAHELSTVVALRNRTL
jgi:type IV pilus assembly protein PilW